jgi:exonuclease VII small subunit
VPPRASARGGALTRLCQKALGDAERKIRVLAKGPDGELREQDFEAPETD